MSALEIGEFVGETTLAVLVLPVWLHSLGYHSDELALTSPEPSSCRLGTRTFSRHGRSDDHRRSL